MTYITSENNDSDTEPFAQLRASNVEDNTSSSGNGILEVVNEHDEVADHHIADHHMEVIPTSENSDSDTEPFAQLRASNVEDNTSSSGYGILEVVNEHNEVLGVIQGFDQNNELDVIPENPPQAEQQETMDQYPIPPHDVHDYEPPPFPDDMFSNSDSDSDTPGYYLQSSDEEEAAIPQIRVPLQNHSRDIEHPDDFSNNWLWIEEDTGASYSQFTANPGLNIRPSQPDPLGYFQLFFDPAMYTRLAAQTNEYARQRIQKRTGYSIITR